ncbi:MAG: ParB/RepB/Spo0J family partition protein [Treponema sp.]|jgi:ParB/RepB/Spo0J family partition protein|nr:ParB/RepB/Spo0J family partition protein [Treponema sp.]
MKKEKAIPVTLSNTLLEPVVEIAVEKIACVSDRAVGGMGDLTQLTASIGDVGLINPIVLAKDAGADTYRVVAGKRRFAAVEALEWTAIPAFVIAAAHTEKATEIALAENVNRLDMHPLDEAAAFKRLEDAGMSVKDIAGFYARSVAGIYQRLRLCDLIDEIKRYLRDNRVTLAQAALLASLTAEQQEAFCNEHRKSKQIYLYHIENFFHEVQHNTLCGITNERCDTCSKRTRHTDNELFPEFSDLNDVCYDDVCYRKAWRQTLALKIADQPEEKREKTGNYLIRDKRIDELFWGNPQNIDLEGVDYTLLDRAEYRLGVPEPEFWAWQLMPWGDKWELASCGISQKGAEDEEGAAEKKPVFDETIDFAGISEPEERLQAEDTLHETYKSHSDLSEKVRDTVFDKLIAVYGDLSRKKLDKAFLQKIKKDARYQHIFLAYTGHAPSDKAVAELTEQKMLTILTVGSLDYWELPRLSEVETGRVKANNPYAKLFGLKLEAFIQLYKDTTAEVVQSALNGKPGEGVEEYAEPWAEEEGDEE